MTNSLANTGINDESQLPEEALIVEQNSPNMWQRIRGYVGTSALAVAAVIGAADNTANAQQNFFATTNTKATTTATTPAKKTTTTSAPTKKIDDSYLQFPVDPETHAETKEYRVNNRDIEKKLIDHLCESAIYLEEFLPEHVEQMKLDGQDAAVRGPGSKSVGHFHMWLQNKVRTARNNNERAKYQTELNKYPLVLNSNEGMLKDEIAQGVHIVIGRERYDVAWLIMKNIDGTQTIINGAITGIEHGQDFKPTTDDLAAIEGIVDFESSSYGAVRHRKANRQNTVVSKRN
jgi:hypothetical protein